MKQRPEDPVHKGLCDKSPIRMIGNIQTQSIHDIQHNRRRLQGYQLIVHIGVRLKKPQIGKEPPTSPERDCPFDSSLINKAADRI